MRLVELLWRVAYANEVLHKYEEHLVRKVADLLYVPHTAFIKAKHRAGGGPLNSGANAVSNTESARKLDAE